jgi:ketosteroid isomerase-like protein
MRGARAAMTRWGSAMAAVAVLAAAGAAAARGEAGASSQEHAVAAAIDDWHAAAAAADEGRYFGHMTENAVFLGTDPTERWTKAQFRAYAHPYFARGKAWSFRSVRRDVSISRDGSVAWFDEDLATTNLGSARGTGVLVREGTTWKVAQYNLSVPIPNAVFKQVKEVIAHATAAKP